MKTTELRIGNWVLCEPNNASIERTIDYEDFRLAHFDSERFEPIPLTEEWLERFNWNPPKDIGVSFSLTTDEIHFVAGNYYKKIKYVHQLQNLFYCLCGEELELKA